METKKTIKFWTKEEDAILKTAISPEEAAKLLPGRTVGACCFRKTVTLANSSKVGKVYTKKNTSLKTVDTSSIVRVKSETNNITVGVNGYNITADINTIKKLINL